jgi:hypothetical protein
MCPVRFVTYVSGRSQLVKPKLAGAPVGRLFWGHSEGHKMNPNFLWANNSETIQALATVVIGSHAHQFLDESYRRWSQEYRLAESSLLMR